MWPKVDTRSENSYSQFTENPIIQLFKASGPESLKSFVKFVWSVYGEPYFLPFWGSASLKVETCSKNSDGQFTKGLFEGHRACKLKLILKIRLISLQRALFFNLFEGQRAWLLNFRSAFNFSTTQRQKVADFSRYHTIFVICWPWKPIQRNALD